MSSPAKEPSTRRGLRSLNFLPMLMLRLRLSWMRSRRQRMERRLDRELARLRMLERLQAEQLHLVRRLERELSPPLVIQLPEPEHQPTPEELAPLPLMQLPEPEPTPEPEPEEPPTPFHLEIARQLGLQQPPT